jgi:hypothetical protein
VPLQVIAMSGQSKLLAAPRRPMATIEVGTMNGRTRAAGALVAAMVLLTGCSPSRPAPAPAAATASAQPSAWDAATGRVAANGRLDLPTALSAFALAVGPVPGAEPAPGAKGPITSGTLAVTSVLAHWAELSAGQRTAVLAVLNGTGARNAPAAYRAPQPTANPNIRCLTADSAGAAPYRAMLPGIESDVSAHLGRRLRIADHVFIAVNTKDLEDGALMYAYGCNGAKAGRTGDGVTGCTIHINPSTLAGTEAELHSYLVHEVVHCFLFDRFGMAYAAMPAWYVEGAPTWAMSQYGTSSARLGGIWKDYLDTPSVPLSGRSYDGLGFFVHLAETGTDVWAAIDRIGAAMRGKGADATGYGWAAAKPTAGFAGSWGGGFVQGRYPGPAWTSGGAPLPPYSPALPTGRLADGATLRVTAPAYAAAVRRLDVDAEVVVVAGAGTAGRLTLGGGTDAALDGGPFCTTGACSCPAGSSGSGTAFTAMAGGDVFLGTTGGAHAADVQLSGSSLADFCAKPRTSCLVGTWRTTAFAIANRAITEHGGAGVRMRIEPSGKTTVGFGGMSPVTFTATTSGTHTAGRFTFAGTLTGEVRLPSAGVTSGRWEPVRSGGTGGLTVDLTITEPFGYHLPRTNVGQLAGAMNTGGAVGSPQLTAGTWRCAGDSLVSTAPPAAGVTGTWTLARTG